MKTTYRHSHVLALFLMLVLMTAKEVQSLPRFRAASTTPFIEGRPAGACCEIGKAQWVLVALNAMEASQRVKLALEVLV